MLCKHLKNYTFKEEVFTKIQALIKMFHSLSENCFLKK